MVGECLHVRGGSWHSCFVFCFLFLWLLACFFFLQSWRKGPGCTGGDGALTAPGLQPTPLFLQDDWCTEAAWRKEAARPRALRLAREPRREFLVTGPSVQARNPLLNWYLASCSKSPPCHLWLFKFGISWEFLVCVGGYLVPPSFLRTPGFWSAKWDHENCLRDPCTWNERMDINSYCGAIIVLKLPSPLPLPTQYLEIKSTAYSCLPLFPSKNLYGFSCILLLFHWPQLTS